MFRPQHRRSTHRARAVGAATGRDAFERDLTRIIPWLGPGLALLLCVTIWLVWATEL